MAQHESLSGWELASEQDLKRLYDKTQKLMTERGTFRFDDSAVVEGVYEGLPITEVHPEFTLELAESEVAALSPQAKEILNLSDRMELSFFEPCYSRRPKGELEYYEPHCAYTIYQPPDSHLKHRYLTVHLNGEDTAYSDSMDEIRERQPTQLSDMIESWRLEKATGINKMTVAEQRVLEEIIDGLLLRYS